MGAAGADWLVHPERAAEEQPDKAIELIGIAFKKLLDLS